MLIPTCFNCLTLFLKYSYFKGMLRDTELYSELMQIAVHGDKKYIIYGDPACPMSELILKPRGGVAQQFLPDKQIFSGHINLF